MNAITIYPTSTAQENLLIALAREMKMQFTTDTQKSDFLSSLSSAAEEAIGIAAGKVTAQTLDELLEEA